MVKRILIVEGNTKEENSEFTKVGINTHTESLIESLNFYNKQLNIDIANPSSDINLKKSIDNFSLTKIGNLIREARISRNQSINELNQYRGLLSRSWFIL